MEIYERLLTFKQWGMDHLLVNHPADTWHDGDGNTGLTLEERPPKVVTTPSANTSTRSPSWIQLQPLCQLQGHIIPEPQVA